jgi:hypothetical protein
MSASIQPDELAKYAPRWMREGTERPRYATTFPQDVQVAVDGAGEPPWRGPSPFDGDVRRWRAEQPSEAQVDDDELSGIRQQVVVINTTMHLPGTRTGKLLRAVAIVSLMVVPLGAAAMIFFPSDGRDSDSALTADGYTIKSVSVVAKSSPGDVAPKTTDDSASAERLSPQVANAMYLVPGVDPAPALAPQSQPQAIDATPAAPPKQTQVQPQRGVGARAAPSPVPQNPQALHISQDEIDRLIKRGEGFMAQGDVLAARAFLERAAEAGDARAALALGSTYDPSVLKNMGVVGIRPDAEQAHRWYERAAEYGSKEASQRITALAQLGR